MPSHHPTGLYEGPDLQQAADTRSCLHLSTSCRQSEPTGRIKIPESDSLSQELQAHFDVPATLGSLVAQRHHGLAEDWAATLGREQQARRHGETTIDNDCMFPLTPA